MSGRDDASRAGTSPGGGFGAEGVNGHDGAWRMIGVAFRNTAMLSAIALMLGACESSSRLRSLLPDDYSASARANPQAPTPLTPAPSTDVDTSALPPLPGAAASAPPGAPGAIATAPVQQPATGSALGAPGAPIQPSAPGQLPSGAEFPAGQPGTIGAAAPPRVATAPAAPTRTAMIGNWSLAEAAGNRCRITLSSAPKLDLYGAGTSGCQSRELQRVNAWELSGSEVILYEPGGGVVARLRQNGAQTFAGAAAKTGAPISISK